MGSFQYHAYIVLSFVLFCAVWFTPHIYFTKYFGQINPLLLFTVLFVLGMFSFNYLNNFGFSILGNRIWKGLKIGLLSASIFFGVVLLADLQWGFPRDINVPFPASLTFYPIIGYMVEVLFHLLPISVILFFLVQTNLVGSCKDRQIVVTFFFVILLEACYQAYYSYIDDPEKLNLVVFVFFHLLTFTFLELWLFRKFDFFTMYFFRFFYYVLWHLLWGYYRIDLLF